MDVLISEEAIKARVSELAGLISADYEGRVPLLVGVLKGSFVFLSDLVRKLDIELEVDFMSVSSYGAGTQSSGVVKIIKDLDVLITGRDVLIVEDILDTGLTLDYLIEVLGTRDPSSIKLCALLHKRKRDRANTAVLDYVGFEIDDEFVVGYGLDYDGRYRNLPYVAIMN